MDLALKVSHVKRPQIRLDMSGGFFEFHFAGIAGNQSTVRGTGLGLEFWLAELAAVGAVGGGCGGGAGNWGAGGGCENCGGRWYW